MPTWAWMLIVLLVTFGLFGDLRRNAAEARLGRLPRRGDRCPVRADDRLYPITQAQLQQYVRDVHRQRRLGLVGCRDDLRGREAVGGVAEHLELARGRLPKPGSPLLN